MAERPAAPESDTRWRSGGGFMLAALGSAVGLGNVWRFSYVVGENGGGAFLLVYLLALLLVGVPLLVAEFALGRAMRRESVAAIRRLAAGSPWRHIAWLSLVAPSLVLAYYSVVAGWVLRYLMDFSFGPPTAAGDHAAAFSAHVAGTLEPLAWQAVMLGATAAAIANEVTRGIERLNRVLMPLLALLLLAMLLQAATLDGFSRGLAFLFRPDWAALAQPRVYVAALGQVFFSLGLAMGVMVTFGSYLPRGTALHRPALAIAFGDTLAALAAGLVIFPAVFTLGLDPAQGPGLAFVVLPEVFARIPGGRLVGVAFFLLLTVAALTSMASLLEVPVAYTIQRFRVSRATASWAWMLALFLLGVPASLGYGAWSRVRDAAGRGILELMDAAAVDLLLPLNGLLLSLLIGWAWNGRRAAAATGIRPRWLAWLWLGVVRFLLPTLLLVVLGAGIARL
ncbi:MAG: sodium-dependent transporter [Burkholderiales bacterium]|nr:sodium-dependent transporter [Burkholderiales bacterium]